MNNKIIIINGPNLNLLGEREQSQYGSTTFDQLKENCSKKGQEIGLDIEFAQSNIEGELSFNIRLSKFNIKTNFLSFFRTIFFKLVKCG